MIYDQDFTIHMYSGITSGRELDGELLYTKILEVNLFAFSYRVFHGDFSPIDGTLIRILYIVNTPELLSTICKPFTTQ